MTYDEWFEIMKEQLVKGEEKAFLESVVKFDAEQDAIRNILKAVKVFGIEGTEDKIKDLYSTTPKLRDFMLEQYYKLFRGK